MSEKHPFFSHATLERNVGWLIVATILAVAVAGLVQIVPLYFQHSTTTPSPGIKPFPPLNLAGRDIFQREGCSNCHSQQIRLLRSETERYGPYSLAGESVYDHPFFASIYAIPVQLYLNPICQHIHGSKTPLQMPNQFNLT